MSSLEITIEEANILFRETVEELIADGCSIIASPLYLSVPGDEIYPAMLKRLSITSDEHVHAFYNGDFDAVARWLGVSAEAIEEHLPVSKILLFFEAQDRRGITGADASDDLMVDLLAAWLETFADGHLFDPERPELQSVALPEALIVSTSHNPSIPREDLEHILEEPPINAWLMVGDEKSFLSSDELEALRDDPEARIDWTAPRQIQPGDLVFIYYIAPRKAVHFVARAASYPVFNSSIEVNAAIPVDPHQWWVELSDIEPVPAVPFVDLSGLMDGHLILRGKPSHYVPPRVVTGLRRLIGSDHKVPIPVGSPDLPDPHTMTFEQWKSFSTGPLSLETQIEQYVVEPLLRLALSNYTTSSPMRAMKLPVGVPDYVVKDGNLVTGAIEVKIGVQTPADLDWKKSPEVRQILRYMRHLDTPGILIDANRVFFLDRDADIPNRIIERKEMTTEDLDALAQHLTARSTTA